LSSNTPILNPEDILQSVIVTNTASAFVDTTSNSDLYYHQITSNVSGGASCHTCTQQRHSPCNSHIRDYLSTGIPNWVRISKFLSSLSLCTQCASIAHSQQQISNIAHHCRNHCVRKKVNKQQHVLCEVAILCNQHKLSIQEIKDEVIVFDGGNHETPPILPPDRLTWQCKPISDLYVQDKTNPNIGLLCPGVNNSLPFIRLQHSDALSIIASSSLNRIYAALEACEKLRKFPLVRGEQKRIFTNYGKCVMYTCVWNQVSRNSPQVLDHAPFQDKLKGHHWEALMWMMRCAELCFKMIANHQVVRHICHARMVVPFKTMSGSKYYGGIAYVCNVFLCCHTNTDFTMSISQVFLKGRNRYKIDNEVVVYFCFTTLGVAVPLRPGEFLLFTSLIPHCILSQCKLDDNIMCVSMYLKSAAVGMNNNSLSLTSEQEVLAIRDQSCVSK
jgi:hypothetical protein